MNDRELLSRISTSPRVLGGKPVIHGTRLSVEFILNLLGHGSTVQEIVDEYRGVLAEDVQACLLFAARSLGHTSFMPLVSEPA